MDRLARLSADVLRHAPLVETFAAYCAMPEELVLAIVQVESSGDPWAWNPEPHYRYLVNVRTGQPFRALTPLERNSETPPKDFPCLAGDPDQEWWGQQASWGLMQLMGACARERGFKGPYLTELCDPAMNLRYGCQHLNFMRRRYFDRHGLAGVLSAWNTGSPQSQTGAAYAAKVLALVPHLAPGGTA